MNSSAAISERMLKVCVHSSLGASGLTSLISSVTHYLMGVDPIVPSIEFAQFFVEVCLWFYATQFNRYREVFPLQLLCAFTGMACVLIVGGSNFLTNCFWISLVSPVAMLTGYRALSKILFFASISLIGVYFAIHSPASDSMGAIFGLDALLFTLGMAAFVYVFKTWYDKLATQVDLSRKDIETLERQKLDYFIQVNHELRNPLTAMMSSIEILIKDQVTNSKEVPQDDESRELHRKRSQVINTIKATSQHILSIINDVLEIERIESHRAELVYSPFSVREMIREVIDIYDISARASGNSLRMRVASDLADEWIGHGPRTRQILLNLTSNAIKHAPGTLVTISVSEVSEQLQFQVADEGPGLSIDEKSLFSRFTSGLGDTGSSGLGLSICKAIVEQQMNGTIEVGPNTGKGSIFTVRIPFKKKIAEDSQWEYVESRFEPDDFNKDQLNTEALKGKNLLLVEDDEMNVEVMTMAFIGTGINMECAKTSQEAMAILKTGKVFDIAIIDHNLGLKSNKDGIELTNDLLKSGIHHIFGHTGNYSKEMESRWKAAGAKEVMRKPMPLRDVLLAISNAIPARI